jgi:ribosomal protein S18 acetylase RimI-like enzyme
MAALPDSWNNALIELGTLTAADLSALLQEEIGAWKTGLNWDFRPSAELVRRFTEMHALTGFALVAADRSIAGYAYYVCEDGKGLIGDLYVRAAFRSLESENALLTAVLDAMWRTPGNRRVEAQLMMLSSPLERAVPFQQWFHGHRRRYLELQLASVSSLPPRELHSISILPWAEKRQDDAARLIAGAYHGHVDSSINDQYRSPGGARRFLTNIVQYPGCGAFFGPASYMALESDGRTLAGLCLASMVAPDCGHITQICVSPAHRDTGLGYELLRRSLVALAGHGSKAVSLTVTAANHDAVRLYERMGFRTRREFAAYVWEKR